MDKFRIGNTWYDVTYHKVVKSDSNESLAGEIDFVRKTIRICSKDNPQTILITKFHEATHGLFRECNIDEREDETRMMSDAFYGFIIDNPTFIREILKYGRKMKNGKN